MNDFGLDFGKMLAPVNFAEMIRHKEARGDIQEEEPRSFLSRAEQRRFASLRAAADFLPAMLPQEHEAWHGSMLGYFDLADLQEQICKRFGCPVESMNLKTLSLSTRNISSYCRLLDSGTVKSIGIVAAEYFSKIEDQIFVELLAAREGRNLRIAVSRDHSKLTTLACEDGRRFTIETSSNQRSNRSREHVTIFNDPALFAFRNGEIEEALARYAIA